MKHKRTSYLEHFTLVNPVHPGYRNLPFLALNSDQWSHPSILTDLFDICPAGPFFYLALWNGFINIETLLSKPLLLLASLFLYCSNIQQLIMWFLSTTFSLSAAVEVFLCKSYAWTTQTSNKCHIRWWYHFWKGQVCNNSSTNHLKHRLLP